MTIIESITDVFTAIAEWISDSLSSLMSLFYNSETGLTIIGVLSVAALAVSIAFLLINTLSDFLRFRN